MNRSLVIVCGLGIGVGACAAPDPGTPEWAAYQNQKKQETRVEAAKTSVEDLPSWYLSPPSDEVAVYAPGTAASSDLQLAVDKATLAAKRSLADRLNSRLSAKMKEFVSESGSGDDAKVLTESEHATTNVIAEVNLAGYEISDKKILPTGAQYRAYVLVQYPLGGANRLLVDQVHKNDLLDTHLRASKAFQDLEKDLEAAKSADKPAG